MNAVRYFNIMYDRVLDREDGVLHHKEVYFYYVKEVQHNIEGYTYDQEQVLVNVEILQAYKGVWLDPFEGVQRNIEAPLYDQEQVRCYAEVLQRRLRGTSW